MMDNIYKNLLNERIKQYGISALTVSDEEAINMLTGIPLTEAKKLIEEYGLLELIKFRDGLNLTQAQIRKLDLVYHLVMRISVSGFKGKESMNSSIRTGEYFVKELQFQRNEVFLIALLNAQNRLIRTVASSNGTLNEASVYPREVMKIVLDNNANSVILTHNHPGGSQEPSHADIELTRKLKEALLTIGVKVVDHIIVADSSYISFAEKGLL